MIPGKMLKPMSLPPLRSGRDAAERVVFGISLRGEVIAGTTVIEVERLQQYYTDGAPCHSRRCATML